MALDYNVVFEYTPKIGGYAGIRFIRGYNDEADFQNHNQKPNDTYLVIAKGITMDEAQDLVALTPEICRFTAAIYELCDNDEGKVYKGMITHQLHSACFGIAHDREWIEKKDLDPVPVGAIVKPTGDQTERDQLYQFILETYYFPTLVYGRSFGLINDLDTARIKLFIKITQLIDSRKEN